LCVSIQAIKIVIKIVFERPMNDYTCPGYADKTQDCQMENHIEGNKLK